MSTVASTHVPESVRHAKCRCRPVLNFLSRRTWVYVQVSPASTIAHIGSDTLKHLGITVCPGCGYGYRYFYGKEADSQRTRDRLS